MKFIFPIILFICGILAFYFAITILCSKDRNDFDNRLIAAMCIGSSIWSLGFGALFLQTSSEMAWRCRAIGMSGTFLYLIMAQILVCYFSGIPKWLSYLFVSLSLLGIPIYFLTIDKSQTEYMMGTFGMTYSFAPGFVNNLYTAYTVMIALCILSASIYMVHYSSSNRTRAFGKRFLLMVLLMSIGTILDTFLPLLGIPAIPGSTMTQFWGMTLLFLAARANTRSKITVANMSEFIYYSMTIPILVFDTGRRLQIANDAAAEFLNINPAILPQKNISIRQLFDVSEDTAFNFPDNCRYVDAQCGRNQLYCNLAINKVFDRYKDLTGYIVIITDLSEQMKNMQNLEEAKLEAEAANRSKSTFLANMSHEIRTPMNAIMGFSELILKMDINQRVREYVSDIKSSCQNLLAVINDILDISKLDSGKMELSCSNFYTGTLFQDVMHIIDIQVRKKGLRFTMDIDPQTPHELYGDKTRIRGILINILNNAVKYTNVGSVTFVVKVLEKTKDDVTLSYRISDTGIGIKESAKAHLFDNFTRFDREINSDIEGTGLGLAIVKGSVQLMGGSIEVDSTYGKGSTFTVVLTHKIIDAKPMECLSSNSQVSSALNAHEMKIRDTRVLVTDDNQINLKVIKSTLEYYGFETDTAASGADAIAMCQRTQYDLVFMDQMMPGMDGIEAMKQIRAISQHYAPGGSGKIIVLTANAIAGMRKELVDKGFDEYLGKPVNFRELERVITTFVPAEKITIGLQQDAIPQKKEASLSELLPDIDVEAGVGHCDGDKDLYLEILHILYDSAPEQLSVLQQLNRDQEYDKFTVHIHSLKGQLLNIGHTTLAESAKELETASREGRHEYIDSHMETFIAKYRAMLKQLETAFAAQTTK